MNYPSRRAKQTVFLVAFGIFLAHAQPAHAQIDPDVTLGAEASTLNSVTFEGRDIQIIEVQVGDYLGEDDIVRLEDIYNRG